ncbi:OVARIAN TUMOR DOMAIN-containing deubiquitinating enzyme 3 [Impatiens glandulifera]|uniref:OVARIAN TUMOR DOMAIN-containing deubiquitinating enzyme 3 n=1 Tax=Impatiens glandulifera TaxID=253017 RepID=UPI001FB1674C|nr:OVARIAN TUMOR DOMAIN-containing deubiquitinating enzyme 3 [Impatiens glandulifera]
MAAGKRFNESVLEQLKHGHASFELVSSPVASIFTPQTSASPASFLSGRGHTFFARIRLLKSFSGLRSLYLLSSHGSSHAMKKLQFYSVQKVTGDGRCLFRALVKGMSFNKGIALSAREERENADDLRMAVKEVICNSEKERSQYEEALIAITVEESLKRYCQRIGRPDFWGGESELLVLSKLCHQPIIVYIPEHEHTRGGQGSGFIPIAEYGAEFGKGSRKVKPKKVVRLLYSGKNHYDLLV